MVRKPQAAAKPSLKAKGSTQGRSSETPIQTGSTEGRQTRSTHPQIQPLKEEEAQPTTMSDQLVEDTVDQLANLPLEIARWQAGRTEREARIAKLTSFRRSYEVKLENHVRDHGSNSSHSDQANIRRIVMEASAKEQELWAEQHKEAVDFEKYYEKRLLEFDKKRQKLVDRGDIQEDLTLPSLLRPEAPSKQPVDRSSELTNSAFLPTSSNAASANPYRDMTRNTTGLANNHRGIPQRNMSGQQNPQTSGPAMAAAPSLIAAQKAREASSDGPASKRPRVPTGNLAIPPVSGSLARQSSLGPGTPKGSNLGSTSRAGSVGSLKTGTAITKKTTQPTKGSSSSSGRKSNLNKSSLNRVKRTNMGGSTSSNYDSDQSDGESAASDGEPSMPSVNTHRSSTMVHGDDEDGDGDGDPNKYCICQRTSHGDMVACDNAGCPYEWFHWSCVGITPPGPPENQDWFCGTPECNRIRGL